MIPSLDSLFSLLTKQREVARLTTICIQRANMNHFSRFVGGGFPDNEGRYKDIVSAWAGTYCDKVTLQISVQNSVTFSLLI